MRFVGVNGINTHGASNVDLVLKNMRDRIQESGELGLEVMDVQLPMRHFISARWGGKKDGRAIANLSDDGDILICHSFGAVRAWHAHKLREYRAIICIAPACSKDLEWRAPSRVWCYYSPQDWVVRLGSWLAFHPFGRAGIEGFSHPDVHHVVMRSDHDDYFDPMGAYLGQICDQTWHLRAHCC